MRLHRYFGRVLAATVVAAATIATPVGAARAVAAPADTEPPSS